MDLNQNKANAITLKKADNTKFAIHADAVLNRVTAYWFYIAVAGMWMFVAYIISLYFRAAIQGNFEGWNKVLAHGYEAGNTTGNLFLGAHLFFAAIITFSGTLQLIPHIRKYALAFHRWNGQLFILAAFAMGISGLYLENFGHRHVAGDLSQRIAVSINGILILYFAALTLRYALARKIDIHRRWALRLFLVVNGTWFFRIGLMLWIFLTNGAGIHWETFSGPFMTTWNFGQYLFPLAVLEIYFYAQYSKRIYIKFLMSGILLLLTLVMGTGIYRAFTGLWLPRM